MIFCGDNYYPSGGWKDFNGHFDDVESAIKWIEINFGKKNYCDFWAHISDGEKIVLYGRSFSSDWEWDEEEKYLYFNRRQKEGNKEDTEKSKDE